MMDNIGVYVSALQESLQKKLDVLLELLKLTKEQGAILKEKEPDMDRFDEIIQEKAKLWTIWRHWIGDLMHYLRRLVIRSRITNMSIRHRSPRCRI